MDVTLLGFGLHFLTVYPIGHYKTKLTLDFVTSIWYDYIGHRGGPMEQIRVRKRCVGSSFMTAEDVAEIIELYRTGNNIQKISRMLGFWPTSCWRILREHSIPTRRRWGWLSSASRQEIEREQVPGGKMVGPGGYLWGVDSSGRRVSEQRIVMEQKVGRPLTETEEVHHIDMNRRNNRPDNLVLFKSHLDHYGVHLQFREAVKTIHTDLVSLGLIKFDGENYAVDWEKIELLKKL